MLSYTTILYYIIAYRPREAPADDPSCYKMMYIYIHILCMYIYIYAMYVCVYIYIYR